MAKLACRGVIINGGDSVACVATRISVKHSAHFAPQQIKKRQYGKNDGDKMNDARRAGFCEHGCGAATGSAAYRRYRIR